MLSVGGDVIWKTKSERRAMSRDEEREAYWRISCKGVCSSALVQRLEAHPEEECSLRRLSKSDENTEVGGC